MKEDDIGTLVVKTAISIHKQLGPGLLETVYEAVLAQELRKQGLKVECQVSVPIKYGDLKFEEGFRADLVIENRVILELKSVEATNNAHKKTVTYLFEINGNESRLLAEFW